MAEKKDKKRKKDQKMRTIYTDFDPEAPETTEFRRIFTRITRRGQAEKIRSILISSSERGEGKTTSAALFAMVSSLHQGLRTCLVDADLHRPRMHRLFDTPREPGLSEILADDFAIETCLKATRYDNLKVVPAGSRRPFPSEMLVPDRLAAMFGKLKLLFDLIVVDAPPLLPVSDPAVLSREVDGVALLVRAGSTQRDVALRAKKILDDVGANLLGVIVNNVDDVLPYYYGHTYYQYGYSSPEEDGKSQSPQKSKPTTSRPGRKGSKKASPNVRATGPPG